MRITSSDVARESGVSRTTVSYVLNAKADVSIPEATRDRVREAATRLGYTPSAAARTLRTGQSSLVLCVLPNWPIGPVIDTMLDNLASTLGRRGLSVLVHHDRGSAALAELWGAVTPRAVVGFTPFAEADELAMRRADIQVLGVGLDENPHHPGVFSVPQARIGRLQVSHLAQAGHRRIGYATSADPRLAEFAALRVDGVRTQCATLGLPAPVVEPVDLEVASGVAAVRSWRAVSPPVTAVAAYNDEVALAVLAALRAEHLLVPDDVAVIGVDDIPVARLASPALTTVSQAIGAEAEYLAAAVVAALDGHDAPPARAEDIFDVVVRDSV